MNWLADFVLFTEVSDIAQKGVLVSVDPCAEAPGVGLSQVVEVDAGMRVLK